MTELELVTVSFKAYRVASEFIHEAAEKSGLSVSDFCRETMVERAANVLGRALPQLPPLQRGRYGNMVAQAATKLGLTRQQFEAQAAQQAAAHALGYTVLMGRPDGGFTTILPPAEQPPKRPSGSYSKVLDTKAPVVQVRPRARAK